MYYQIFKSPYYYPELLCTDKQGKKAFALSADRGSMDFIKSKAKGAELRVRFFL